ncbi:MAG: MFS transporter [Bacteroidota bacterium]
MEGQAFKEFKYGWPVVGSSAIGIGLGMSPLPFYTIGVFVAPFMQEFGWGVADVMLALSIFSFAAFFTSPLIGIITDRIGVRKTVLLSILTFGLCFMAFSLNNGSRGLYLSLWVLLAFLGSGTLPITWTRAINKWFHKKRGLALGISLLGTGLFGAFAKIYASWLIENYGWKMAYVGLALLPLLISLPLAFFLFHDTDDPKVSEKVKRMKEDLPYLKEAGDSTEKEGFTLVEALKDVKFYLLALSFLPISFAIGGPIPNFEKILDTKGFDLTDAVYLASIVGYSVIVGRLLGGYLLDKLWAPGVAFTFFIIPVISCYLFQQGDMTYSSAAMAIAVLGFSAGVEYDLMAFLVSKYFGLKHYSSIYGTLYGFFAIGAGFGPWIFGKSFAATGSYDSIFGYAMIAFVAGALPLLFLGKYRYD